jgi:Family of unknown function (DUF5647)
MSDYANFLAMVSTEFHRYLMENEDFAEKIPANALVVFQTDGDDDFNRWHKETSLKNKEPEQAVILVNVRRWRKHSSIEELNLAEAPS